MASVPGPLARALEARITLLGRAFRRVVFGQVRISALNTLLTGIYLAAVLPLFGINLPLVKTMILVTFLVGLLPVLGNLISNTVIVVVSLSVSLLCRDRLAGLPDRDPQAGIFHQRPHHRRADPRPGLGIAAGHAGDGSRRSASPASSPRRSITPMSNTSCRRAG